MPAACRCLRRLVQALRLRAAGAALKGLAAATCVLTAVVTAAAGAAAAPLPPGFDAAPQLRVEAGQHGALVRRVAVHPQGDRVLTVGDDKTARLWRVEDGRLLATLRVPVGPGDLGRLSAAKFSPDGRELAVAGTSGAPAAPHRIDVFDAASGAWSRALTLDAGHVVRLRWLRSQPLLLACLAGEHGLRLLTPEGRLVQALPLAAPCYGLEERPDGRVLATSFDGQVHDLQLLPDAGGLQRRGGWATGIVDPQSLAVSPDGRWLAVGYNSPSASGAATVDVFDLADPSQRRSFSHRAGEGGGMGAVAWSADGRTLLAAGRAAAAPRQVLLMRVDWPSGREQVDVVASDTILDMAPLPDGRVALVSGNGGWGLVPARGAVPAIAPTTLDMAGADSLRADARGRVLSFGAASPGGARVFHLPRRRTEAADAGGLQGPSRFSFSLSLLDWENHLQPQVAGRLVAMEPFEVSRAAALLPQAAGAVLASSRRLRLFDRDGQARWSQRLPTEVRGVTVADDGRLVISAQSDGTVRWWRARDGALLLSLYMAPDGRWVLWTEQGYFDAAAGADSLIGWHVNRADGRGADFHSVGRFREQFHRPDVIDRVLDTLDAPEALRLADDQRRSRQRAEQLAEQRAEAERPLPADLAAQAAALAASQAALQAAAKAAEEAAARLAAHAAAQATAQAAAQAAAQRAEQRAEQRTERLSAQVMNEAAAPRPAGAGAAALDQAVAGVQVLLPPVVQVLTERAVRASQPLWRVRFTVRADHQIADTLVLRVDGRPAEVRELQMPAQQDGLAQGQVLVAMPQADAQLAVMAQAGALVSEPVFLAWSWRPAPPPVPLPDMAPGVPPRPAEPTATVPAQPVVQAPGMPAAPVAGPATAPGTAPATAQARLTAAAPLRRAAPQGGLVVLAVGVSDYARKDYDLKLAAKDATDFAALLRSQQGRLYTRVEQRVLTDRQATRVAVLQGLEWLRQSVGPGDTAMLFLAGHGLNDAGGRYHFLTHDADADRLARTAVSEIELRRQLAGIRGKVLLFVDTCHAGNVIGSGQQASQEIARLANALSSSESGVIVFSASTGRQESFEQGRWGNGAFTRALIDGLRGGADFARDGVVTHQGLSYYLGREVRKLTRGAQTPVTAVPLGVVDFPMVALGGE